MMNIPAWKCYKCGLIFKHEDHANLHNDVTNHSTQQIELIVKEMV